MSILRTKKSVVDSIVSDNPKGSCNVPVRQVIAEPGNGMRYSLVFTDLRESEDERKEWLVTWINSANLNSMVVTDNGGLLHFSYVEEQMRVNLSDAICLAEIIGYCTGREFITCEQFVQMEADKYRLEHSLPKGLLYVPR